jgi:hypothetical protein
MISPAEKRKPRKQFAAKQSEKPVGNSGFFIVYEVVDDFTELSHFISENEVMISHASQ